MPRSKSSHPRLECAAPHHADNHWKKIVINPWTSLYADTRKVAACECDGLYVIENPKLDEVLRVHRYRSTISVVRLSLMTHRGPQAIGESKYDGDRTVHCLLLEDGTSIGGRYYFRAK